MSAARIGVVVMAYGGPVSHDHIEAYYTDIRRGRPPTAEQLADLVGRYDAIGGVTALAARTEEQRAALAAALDELSPGTYRVVLGTKHSHPSIEAAVAELTEPGDDETDSVDRIVGLVLAPHYSAYSVGQYLGRLTAAAHGPARPVEPDADTTDEHAEAPEIEAARIEAPGIEVAGIDSWATEEAFVEFVATDLQRRLDVAEGRTIVLFTAHSLPERIVATGDPYPDELRATATAVAGRLGLHEGHGWRIAWQSAGRTPEPWIGPDILTVIDEVAASGEYDTVIVSAVGFVSDHLEVLYDLDIEARLHAEHLGLRFDRTRCVNDDPALIGALALRIHRR